VCWTISSASLEFFLHTYHRRHSSEALEIVQHTCREMAEGGMYDQLGGGFHRYSVDAQWLVPHFEKMLYDNALLSRLYLHLFQVTKDDFARRIAQETLDYVVREMTDAGGGFYSSQDADSEGVEGQFFVWSRAEIMAALGEHDGNLFCEYFDITERGNFEGKNILHVRSSLEDTAQRLDVSVEELSNAIDAGRRKLFDIRERRVKPGRDEKVLTAWNGLMLGSFAEGAAILNRAGYRQVAEASASFLLDQMRNGDLLLRTYKDGKAKLNGYLEDYACLIDGLISLYEATGKLRWTQAAVSLADNMIEQFWDEDSGGFYFTGKAHEQLIVRSKEFLDNATPSGNSIAALSLLRLALLTGKQDYHRRATDVLRQMANQIRRYPSAFGFALCALDFYLESPLEIAIVGAASDSRLDELVRTVWQTYLPNRVVALGTESHPETAALVPLLRERNTLNDQPTAFVCEAYTCQTPVHSPGELVKQLTRD